jgi:hypothetical protein
VRRCKASGRLDRLHLLDRVLDRGRLLVEVADDLGRGDVGARLIGIRERRLQRLARFSQLLVLFSRSLISI